MTQKQRMNYPLGLRAYARLFAQEPRLTALVLLLTTLSMLMDSFGLLMLVPLLATLTGGAADTPLAQSILAVSKAVGVQPTLGAVLGAFLVLMAARSLMRIAKDWASTQLRTALTDRLRNEAMAAIMAAEMRWLNAHKRSDQTNMLLTEVQRVATGVHGVLALQATWAAMAAYMAVAVVIEPVITSIVAIVGAVLFALFASHRRKAVRLGMEQTEVNRALHETALETIGAIKLAKILGTQATNLRSFAQATSDLRANQIRFAILSGVSRELSQFIGLCLVAGYIFFGVTLWKIPVAELLVLVLIFARLAPMLTSAQQWLQVVLNTMPSLLEAQDVIAKARDAAEPIPLHDASPLRLTESLNLHEVTIAFTGQERPALDGVSLKLPAGSTTLITGPSGAGKSTLADILMGLLAPDKGNVALDGASMDGPDRIAWRKSVSYVPQDVTLYNGTIRENLTRARPAATDDEIEEALRSASADFVFSLPHGLDTRIGDGAITLSGGERQRIALARGLLKKPALLVLDEVTSALDQANETRIREALAKLAGTVTIVILGHRKGFDEIADQILGLEEGRILTLAAKD